MTTVFVPKRIAHLIADGKVTIHLASAPLLRSGPPPWLPGHSYPVRVDRGPARCRVVVSQTRRQTLDSLTPRELHDSGHRTRLDLARWCLRGPIAAARYRGVELDDAEILKRFAPLAAVDSWRVDFALDLEHQPRLLHADPAQDYTSIPQHAAAGEPEALSERDIERLVVLPARRRAATGRGHIEQEAVDELGTLEQRLARIRKRAKRGVDVRSEIRMIEHQIAKAEAKIARVGS